MKGSIITLTKNGVEVKTQFISQDEVKWTNPEVENFINLRTTGWDVKLENPMREALKKAELIWEKFCFGSKPKNTEFIELIRLIERALD